LDVQEVLRVPLMDDLDLDSKHVLIRLDLNVPVDPKSGEILDDSRLRAHIPTLKELIERGCSVVAVSHQGRPGMSDFLELKKHSELLGKILGREVHWIDDVMGPAARGRIKELGSGEILLLDNIRFVSEESIEAEPEKHAKSFLVQRLYKLFDAYVNDAFATAHRSHASIVGFPLVLPSAAGRLMEREIKALARIFDPEERPMIFVLGGSKVHDTIRIIENLVRKNVAERILTTGLIAELFLVAKGVNLGRENMNVLEEMGVLSLVPRARRLLLQGAPIETPIDFKVEKQNNSVVESPPHRVEGIIKDIGEATANMYAELMKDAKLIVIRGPAGVIEDPRFKNGTRAIVKSAIENVNAFTILGGGHLSAIADELGVKGENLHVSTGGGALLLFLAGERLPALEALRISAEKFLGWK